MRTSYPSNLSNAEWECLQSLGIYAGVPLLYFIGITFVRRAVPQGSLERDLT